MTPEEPTETIEPEETPPVSFTYEDPSNSPLEAIRYLIQDTDPNQVLLSDGEIAWNIKFWGDKGGLHFVASKCCKSIAAKFAREVSFASDSQSISLSELMQKYQALASALMADEESASVGELFVGGGWNTDIRGPSFSISMHDDPEAGPQYVFPSPYPDPHQWGTGIP